MPLNQNISSIYEWLPFILFGISTGALQALAILRLDTTAVKSISLTVGSAAVLYEYDIICNYLNTPKEQKHIFLVFFLGP